jgi:hypothetical protein
MANIKLFGNTKIQGKAFFNLSESAPTPTYAIGRSIYNVNEGSSVTFTLSTTNVANGTLIPYTISGISLSDLSSGSLNGNFVVSNNLATATVALTADNLTEGTEEIIIALFDGQPSSFALAIDTSLSLPMTLSGTNLVGWYDYTYGAYNAVGNFVDDENASTWTISMIEDYTGAGNFQKSTVNGRTSYNNFVYGSSGYYSDANISMYWTGSNWRVEIVDKSYTTDGDFGTSDTYYDPDYISGSIYWDATGDTRYPWEANWGTGNSVTRPATTSSTLATEGQTVTLWRNKVNTSASTHDGFSQGTLATQPVLSAGSIQLNTKWMSLFYQNRPFATRTYYFVGNARNTQTNTTRSILSFAGTTATTSTLRHALVIRNTSNVQRYGLSQSATGSGVNSTYVSLSSWTGKPQIICASFSSANNGKISLNNSSESSLTAIGNNFPSQANQYDSNNPLYLGSSEANSFINVKEILVFDTVHTTEQKTQVINYLNAKYNAF